MAQAIVIGASVVVETKDGKITGVVSDYNKGWFAIVANVGGETIKARAKQLTLDTPADEEPKKKEVSLKIKCTECGHKWQVDNAGSAINVRCPECKAWNNIHIQHDKDNYVRGIGETAKGNDTYDIGDATADSLRGLDYHEATAVTGQAIHKHIQDCGMEILSRNMRKALKDVDTSNADQITLWLQERYANRNEGMQRMNLGNILRAMAARAAGLDD